MAVLTTLRHILTNMRQWILSTVKSIRWHFDEHIINLRHPFDDDAFDGALQIQINVACILLLQLVGQFDDFLNTDGHCQYRLAIHLPLHLVYGTFQIVHVLLYILCHHFWPPIMILLVGQQRHKHLVDQTGQLIDRSCGQIAEDKKIAAVLFWHRRHILFDEVDAFALQLRQGKIDERQELGSLRQHNYHLHWLRSIEKFFQCTFVLFDGGEAQPFLRFQFQRFLNKRTHEIQSRIDYAHIFCISVHILCRQFTYDVHPKSTVTDLSMATSFSCYVICSLSIFLSHTILFNFCEFIVHLGAKLKSREKSVENRLDRK